MEGTIVSFDVSKGSCHYQGFIDRYTSFTKPRILKFTKSSFKDLESYVSKLKMTADVDSVFYVFEATGVYHEVLKKYLDDNHLDYYIISPLLSAKHRQTELHSNKTDPLDCANIAKVYYSVEDKKLNKYKSPVSRYENLKRLNRYYEDVLVHLRKYKVTLRSYLDIAMPDFDSCFSKKNIYNPLAMEILKKYPHPDLILRTREETMIKYLENNTNHNRNFIVKYVSKIRDWAKEVYSGCDKDSVIVDKIKVLVKHIEDINKEAEEVLQSMVDGAKDEYLFVQLLSIPGIGTNLAARLIAEIGDISRFDNINKLSSYAGVDPMIRQSGDKDGVHLSISKKGNKYLRCLLYLAVGCNLRLKKNDQIYNFCQRKRQQFAPPKVAKIATCRKLLTITYGMSKTGEMYIYTGKL